MKFYLGTHRPNWLGKLAVPLFVSHRQLSGRQKLAPAVADWALDSGAFSELQMHGRFTYTPRSYATAARRYAEEIGRLDWCAPQDWMCEPFMVDKTGLTVDEHLHRTVGNYLDLMAIDPTLPWAPVVQGFSLTDYENCISLYETAGVVLADLPVVGIGSVCRRQKTEEIEQVIRLVSERVPRLHGFGVKFGGFRRYGALLASADSLAWSYNARRNPPLDGCAHKNCANCSRWALRWRERLVSLPLVTPAPLQGTLW